MAFAARWQRFALAALVMMLCLTIPACKSKVTSENFMKLKPGMTEKEVNDILGSPDKTSEKDAGPLGKLKIAEWKSGDNTVEVTYDKDGKLMGQKGNFGAK